MTEKYRSAMNKPQPSFGQLPQELVENIIQGLTRQDLSSLSKTSKAIRARTSKALYANIYMRWEGNAASTQHPSEMRTTYSPRLDLLLRSVLEVPDFAMHVTSVEFQAVGFRRDNDCWSKPSLPKPQVPHSRLLEAASHQARVPQGDRWDKAIKENSVDAIVSLFLAVCQNMTNISLGLDFVRNNPYLPEFLIQHLTQPTSDGPVGFPKLKTVRIGARIDDDEVRLDTYFAKLWISVDVMSYLALFFAPALEHAEMNLNPDHPRSGATAISPHIMLPEMKKLKTLRLNESTIQPETLGKILRRTPALIDFSYQHYIFCDHVLQGGKLQRALEEVKDTLTRFELTCWFFDDDRIYPWECTGAVVSGNLSFKEFPALKYLQISPAVLLGWYCKDAPNFSDVLPPSLVTLALHAGYDAYPDFEWTARELMRHFGDLLQTEQWRNIMPMLERCDLGNKYEWFSEEKKEEMKSLCGKNGIICSFNDQFEEAE